MAQVHYLSMSKLNDIITSIGSNFDVQLCSTGCNKSIFNFLHSLSGTKRMRCQQDFSRRRGKPRFGSMRSHAEAEQYKLNHHLSLAGIHRGAFVDVKICHFCDLYVVHSVRKCHQSCSIFLKCDDSCACSHPSSVLASTSS